MSVFLTTPSSGNVDLSSGIENIYVNSARVKELQNGLIQSSNGRLVNSDADLDALTGISYVNGNTQIKEKLIITEEGKSEKVELSNDGLDFKNSVGSTHTYIGGNRISFGAGDGGCLYLQSESDDVGKDTKGIYQRSYASNGYMYIGGSQNPGGVGDGTGYLRVGGQANKGELLVNGNSKITGNLELGSNVDVEQSISDVEQKLTKISYVGGEVKIDDPLVIYDPVEPGAMKITGLNLEIGQGGGVMVDHREIMNDDDARGIFMHGRTGNGYLRIGKTGGTGSLTVNGNSKITGNLEVGTISDVEQSINDNTEKLTKITYDEAKGETKIDEPLIVYDSINGGNSLSITNETMKFGQDQGIYFHNQESSGDNGTYGIFMRGKAGEGTVRIGQSNLGNLVVNGPCEITGTLKLNTINDVKSNIDTLNTKTSGISYTNNNTEIEEKLIITDETKDQVELTAQGLYVKPGGGTPSALVETNKLSLGSGIGGNLYINESAHAGDRENKGIYQKAYTNEGYMHIGGSGSGSGTGYLRVGGKANTGELLVNGNTEITGNLKVGTINDVEQAILGITPVNPISYYTASASVVDGSFVNMYDDDNISFQKKVENTIPKRTSYRIKLKAGPGGRYYHIKNTSYLTGTDLTPATFTDLQSQGAGEIDINILPAGKTQADADWNIRGDNSSYYDVSFIVGRRANINYYKEYNFRIRQYDSIYLRVNKIEDYDNI